MKRAALLILFAIVIGLAAFPASAQVIIPQPGVFTNPEWLQIDFHRVQVTIENQVAQTTVDLQFTNNGEALAEGTFLFPLPEGAAVDRLTMIINGESYDANLLSAEEARSVYDEIVRQYRDPALLEYVGRGAIQANVFPIPPGESRRVQIDYSYLLEVDNGLVEYVYPLNPDRRVDDFSISVEVTSNDPISTIYSPSHNLGIQRQGDKAFRAGYESALVSPGTDFTLYYGIASDSISVNLLTYRESANQDGFFMLLVQPPLSVAEETVVPKDVILVIDQSGSMDGDKWIQAQQAAAYVLENLNASDRFNVIVFSTGYRVYSNEMLPSADAGEAVDWINGLYPEGGTNISDSLTAALNLVGERPTTILFMTDGEATEGVIETPAIMDMLNDAARPNARIFTFGVGDTVNTILLDTIVRDFRGASTYVRPTQRIDESVASLFNKINAPVLTDVEIDFGGLNAELMYPQQLNDLFVGEQITLVGRYRQGMENGAITLSGTVNGQPQTFTYSNLTFRDRAGGEPFIARLWATRRIADLLNTIRINGESEELVDSVVSLSVRYGIITPYTSFLITEDDILTQGGRERAVEEANFGAMSDAATGGAAVDQAQQLGQMAEAEAAAPVLAMPGTATPMGTMSAPGDADERQVSNPIQTVGDKTFLDIDGVWTDTAFEPDTMTTEKVAFLSDAYFALLDEHPELAEYFALGDRVIVVLEDTAYEVTAE